MAQLQFRQDDTIVWEEKFGIGSDGNLTVSADTTDTPIDAPCSGTSGTYTLNANNANFAPNQLVLIIEMKGVNVGKWQFNKITSYSNPNMGLKYPLTNDYIYAQVIVIKQYANVTINNGVTWSAKAWNGSTGGILVFFANGTYTNNGTVNLVGKGYRGGNGGAAGYSADNSQDSITTRAYQGEGYLGLGSQSNNSNAGGGGGSSGGGADGGNGGGGAGYGSDGTDGGAGQGTPGYHGTAYGVANLTLLLLGAGGGGGRGEKNGWSYGGNGGNGGGIFLGVTYINAKTGVVLLNGANGTNATYTNTDGGGGGGGGAGGSGLFKYWTGVLGASVAVSLGGGGGAQGYGAGGNGGNGGVGRFHLDYGASTSGTTSPSIDAVQDPTITITVSMTIQAKADIRKLSVTQTATAKSRIAYYGVTKTVSAKARVLFIKSPPIQAKARVKKNITQTIKALAYVLVPTSYEEDSQKVIRRVISEVEVDWKLNGVYTNETNHGMTLEVERRLTEPVGGISLGVADVVLENTSDRYTPTD